MQFCLPSFFGMKERHGCLSRLTGGPLQWPPWSDISHFTVLLLLLFEINKNAKLHKNHHMMTSKTTYFRQAAIVTKE